MSDVLVLCYHALADRWPASLNVTPDSFREQVSLLARRGYVGATFHQAVNDPPAKRTVAVTFDDAYRSVIERAFPVLSEHGMPATVFAVTKFAGGDSVMSWPGIDNWMGGPHEAELAPMSWEELGRLQEAGWEVGSHTHSHPRLTRLDDAQLDEELVRSREICAERMGGPCRSLAYPYGDYDDRVIAAADRAGYEVAGTLGGRLYSALPLRWPRVGIYHVDSLRRFRAKASPLVRRLRTTRAWGLVGAARR